MTSCPKTYFDLMQEVRPRLISNLSHALEDVPPGQYSIMADDMTPLLGDRNRLTQIIKEDMADLGRLNLRMMGMSNVARGSDEQVIATMPAEFRQSHLGSVHVEVAVLSNFIHHGKKVYYFAENLVERLADTEMNVDEQLVTLPHASCVFVYDCQTVRDAVAKVWGSRAEQSGTVTVFMSMFAKEDGTRSIAMAPVVHEGAKVTTMLSRSLHLRPGGTVEEALDTDWVKINGEGNGMATFDDNHFATAGRRMARIFINSALYLASSNPDIVPRMRLLPEELTKLHNKQRRKIERQQERETKLSFTVVGSTVRRYDRDGSGSGQPLGSRIKVQGHWKTQAHGKAFSLRKIIHVEPYWRGPDIAEVVNRPHVVR